MIKTRAIFSTLVLCTAAMLVRPAHAHDTIPKDWCTEPGTRPVIVNSFRFDGKGLRDFLARCGIVDKDDWYAAHAGALYYCNTPASRERSSSLSPQSLIVPYIKGPQSFYDKDHHITYRIDDGLAGSCVMCVSEK
jgi:hypothetical protein